MKRALVSYRMAKQRCNWPLDKKYRYYGGRGIEFRFQSFDQFYAELGPRAADKSIDRIDNDGHYEPGNVRWATRKQQANNTSKSLKTKDL